jgi:hypothetical protein
MNLLFLMVKSSGLLFGVSMLLAGLVALVLCARATWVRTSRTRRAAVIASLAPLVIGIIGAAVQAVLLWLASQRGAVVAGDWPHLGYVVLFGLTISALPLLWSALLRHHRTEVVA